MSEAMPFDHWAIVEIFGHTRLAGRVQETTVGGCAFVRVDCPETSRHPAFSRLYGQGAIYSITLVSEEVARAAAEQLQERPLTVYLPPYRGTGQAPHRALPAGARDALDHVQGRLYDEAGDERDDDEDDEEAYLP